MILLNQLQLYAKQILNDYDKKKPSVLFKNNINILGVGYGKMSCILMVHS